MKDIIRNIKQLFMKLFGFEEIEENKEWNEYLVSLEQSGYFKGAEMNAFKESAKNMAEFERNLETGESIKNPKKGNLSVKDAKLKLEEVRVVPNTKGLERE